MKFRFSLITMLVLIYTCDRQLVAPVRDNPFDSESDITAVDPFNLQIQNLSDQILINWEYSYEKPTIESFLLYRVDSSGRDTLYTGTATTFSDTTVEWDSTYSYYVTGVINGVESTKPDDIEILSIKRRIMVGEGQDFATIQEAINTLNNGDIVYVKDGIYSIIDFGEKNLVLRSEKGPENCVLYGGNNETVVKIEGGQDSTTILDGFTIRNGFANKGGGIKIDEASPIIQNCIISGNNATNDGGGVYIYDGSPRIMNCIISANTVERNGAGIYFNGSESSLYIENVTFSDNIITDVGGGGGLFIKNGDVRVKSSLFYGNNSEGKYGGGIYCNSAQLKLEICEFRNNESKLKGGGIYLLNSNGFTAHQTIFDDNSGGKGGGIFLFNSDSASIINCIMTNNSSPFGGGSIFLDKLSNLLLEQSTLYGNTSCDEEDCSGILISSNSILTVHNSILWDNEVQNVSEIQLDNPESDSVIVTYSDIKDGWVGVGNINLDPEFEDAKNGYLKLNDGSPCKGKGENGNDMGAFGGNLGNW